MRCRGRDLRAFEDFRELKWKLRLESVLSSWACGRSGVDFSSRSGIREPAHWDLEVEDCVRLVEFFCNLWGASSWAVVGARIE